MADDAGRGLQRVIDGLIIFVLRMIQFVSILVLIAICAVGFTLIGKGCYHFATNFYGSFIGHEKGQHTGHGKDEEHTGDSHSSIEAQEHSDHDAVAQVLQLAFEGLEFLLLAPLSFLVLRSLSEYVEDLLVKDIRRRQLISDRNKTIPDSDHQKGLDEESLSMGKECLLDTKALTVALLFGIVATKVVSQLIAPQPTENSLENSIVGISLMVVLAAVYISIELLGNALKKPKTSKPDGE